MIVADVWSAMAEESEQEDAENACERWDKRHDVSGDELARENRSWIGKTRTYVASAAFVSGDSEYEVCQSDLYPDCGEETGECGSEENENSGCRVYRVVIDVLAHPAAIVSEDEKREHIDYLNSCISSIQPQQINPDLSACWSCSRVPARTLPIRPSTRSR